MKNTSVILSVSLSVFVSAHAEDSNLTYPIVDTAQVRCFSNVTQIEFPKEGKAFSGQDAQFLGNAPSYQNNGDGTVSDQVTGLMWQEDPGAKRSFDQAVVAASACRTGGYDDWRLPSIKELYSLVIFSGLDPSSFGQVPDRSTAFIDTRFFKFQYGDPKKRERVIDSQFASSTVYVHLTMNGNKTMFGVNFADGRIKGYPIKNEHGPGEKLFHVLYVRGNPAYGENKLLQGGKGVIHDKATGLIWMQVDSGHLKAGKGKDGKLNWQEGLAWADELEYAGHSDWRMPNVKELQSIVDYTRSPSTTNSAAIDPLFKVSRVKEGPENDYPYYWASTTHKRGAYGSTADCIVFGKGYGWMYDFKTKKKKLMDVHGAGCQRSDPKTGDPSLSPYGRGPQGDVLRINNFVRCVRGGKAEPVTSGPKVVVPVVLSAGARFIKRLDKDNDGKVSKAEFDGPPFHFTQFDKNHDGFLSEDEAPKGPPARSLKKR